MLAEYYSSPRFGACPENVIESLRAYALIGRPLGGFLEAVIAGDLYQAVARADQVNACSLAVIVAYIHNEMPPECYGSPERYIDWIACGGLNGLEK